MKPITTTLLKSSLVLALMASTLMARADYRSTILGDSPAAFWRLDESNITLVSTNYGSAGAALNANYNLGKFVSRTGAIPGDPNPCTGFDGFMNRVEVPYTPTLNPTGEFSVEFWALRTTSAASTYYSPIWARGNGATANGFLFYINSANRWTFWMGATNAAGAGTWVPPASLATAVNNTWYHIAGTYGPVLTNGVTNWFATLYVNGVRQNSLQVDANGYSYQPNCGSTTAVPYVSPFRIGAGGYAMPSQVPWPGSVDEVAFYTNSLTDLQVSNHWAIATNIARTVSYASAITSDSPIGYWRLDETNTPVAYNQVGASAGGAGNGIYEASPLIPESVDPLTGILINPSNYPASLTPLAEGALVGDSNPALNFMPFIAGSTTGAKVEVPYSPSLNTKTFSVECWANLQTLGSYNAPVSSRYNVTGVWGGWDLLVDNVGRIQLWLGSGENLLNKLVTADGVFAVNTWNHLVASFDGTYMYLHCNGELVGAMESPQGFLPNPSAPLRIGAGASETVQGNFYVNGSVDEVAYYPAPLSQNQITNHYAIARGVMPAGTTVPWFAVEPAGPPAALETGSSASMTGIAIGSLPIQYQWYHDSVLIPYQTNTTLNFSNLTTAASGGYELRATNAAGNAVSVTAYIGVNPPAGPAMIADLPAITPFYPGAAPQLSVAVGGSLPFTFYWTSNGVLVAVTSVPSLSLGTLQASAAGTHYGVTISNEVATLPSTVTTLQALTPVAGDYVTRAMALNPVSYWRLGESSPSTLAVDSWGGRHGQYVSAGQHITPGALGVNDDGCIQLSGAGAYVQITDSERFSKFSTTNQFTLMAWVKPDGVIGAQRVFSTRQITPYGAGFGFGLNHTNLAFSGFGVADLSFSANLIAGRWYHITAVYSNKTVTCYLNGSVVGTARAALNALMPSSAPLYLGGNPSGSEWFAGFIDEAAVYGSALSAAQIINAFGTKPSITLPPASVTALAGSVARFSILGGGQTPLSYEWRTNNVAVVNQTNTTVAFPRVPLSWNNLEITCVVTNGLGAITSAPVTLSVQQGSGYVGSVLADQPVGYWRLNESAGPNIQDFVATHDGTAVGSGITYRHQGVGTPLSPGGDNDGCVGFAGGSGLFAIPFYPELNQGVYSVECWALASGAATTFAAPVSSRLSSGSGFNFYAGQDGNVLGYTWQLWTATGISTYPWDYAVGPVINNYTWTHLLGTYDGTSVVFYVNGEPVVTNATTIVSNTVSPFSIGGIASGAPYTVGTYFHGDVDEVAYYGYALSPYQAMGHYLLATFGDSQAPQITVDLVPQTAYAGQPFSLTAAAVGSVPMSYQWYKNNTPVPGGSGTSYCATNLFALNFANVQPGDAGNYKLWVSNGVNTAESATAALTVGQPPQMSYASYSASSGCQFSFTGPANMGYRIWATSDLTLTPVEETWTLLSSGTFTGEAESFTDADAVNAESRFYILTIP